MKQPRTKSSENSAPSKRRWSNSWRSGEIYGAGALIEGVREAGLRELAELGGREAHGGSGFVFGTERGVEHGGVVGGKDDGDTVAEKSWERMLLNGDFRWFGDSAGRSLELPRDRARRELNLTGERAGFEIADRADFEDDAAVGKEVHEGGIVDGGDAMANALDAKEFNGFANFFGATDFAGVHEAMDAERGGSVVNGAEFGGSDAEFVAADAEGDDGFGGGGANGFDDAHGSFGSELADSVKDPIEAQAFGGEWLGGAEDGFEILFGRLVSKQHDADGERDFGIDNILFEELIAKVFGDEGEVLRVAEPGGDPFESFEEAEEVGVIVVAVDFGFIDKNAVTAGERADGGDADGAFKMKVQFGFG